MQIQNLTTGNHSIFSVPIVKWEKDSPINRVESRYEAGQSSKNYLPIVIDEHLLIIHCSEWDEKMFTATVFQSNQKCAIESFSSLFEIQKRLEGIDWKDQCNEIFKVSHKTEDVYTTSIYGQYHRLWHLSYAADHFGWWRENIALEYTPAIIMDEYPIINLTDWYRGYDAGSYKIVRGKLVKLNTSYYNWKQQVLVRNNHLFHRGKYVKDVADILEVYEFVRAVKPKPAVQIPRIYEKSEIIRLAEKHYHSICDGYRRKLNDLPKYSRLNDLLIIFGEHEVNICLKGEFETSVPRKPGTRKPLGRKPGGPRK